MSIKIGQTTVTQSNISNGNHNQNSDNITVSTIFDWNGTLAEYNTQNIEVLHPDWVCYITDDVAGGESVYTKAQCDAKYATRSLSNIPDNYDYVVESQLPTVDNNYTWYRKYKSGWVEQGGIISWAGASMGSGTTTKVATVSFSVEITKIVGLSFGDSGQFFNFHARNSSETGMDVYASNQLPVSFTQAACEINWQVSGVAA